MARPVGQPPPPFVNLNNHPSMQAFAPLPATAQPTPLSGQIPLAGMPGLGHLHLAPQAMIPGLPPIVVTAVVMPNGAAVHPIQQLGQQKRLRSHATPLTAEEALHAAKLEGLTLHVAPSTKTGYKGTPGPPRCRSQSRWLPKSLARRGCNRRVLRPRAKRRASRRAKRRCRRRAGWLSPAPRAAGRHVENHYT